MKHAVRMALTGALALGCGSSNQTTTVEVSGRLSPAPGLAPNDFEVWGPLDEAGTSLGADGTFKAEGHLKRTGVIFATPRLGSAASTSLGAEGGLYMTPVADQVRVVKQGTGYAVASSGEAVMDATTTVLSLLMMHPQLAHPGAEVGEAQLRWLVQRQSAGWPCLVDAAAAYEAALLAQRELATDAPFTDAIALCLSDAATMPDPTPAVTPGATSPSVQPPGRQAHIMSAGKPVDVLVNKHLAVAGVVKLVAQDEEKAVIAPGTRNGTGLEYLYEVVELDPSLAKQGPLSPLYTAPNGLAVHATTGTVLGSGFIPSSSYFAYLDVVGLAIKKATALVGSGFVETPNRNVSVGKDRMFEVRLWSGGFGWGTTRTAYDFTTTYFPSQHNAALYQNVAMGVVEAIGIIPGASEVLAEGDSGKVLQAVVVKVTTELGALIAAKGGDVTSDDLYNLIYNVVKTAVDNVIIVTSKGAQEGAAKRLLGWLVGGGKKAIKAVVGLPGKIAKGGALGNRAFRLSNPESVMEYFIVAVGYTPGDCLPFIQSMAVFFGTPDAECIACAAMECGAQCEACGKTCVDTGKVIHTAMLDACLICNEKGESSTACGDAVFKSMQTTAYTPGANQPTEKSNDLRVCVVNACDACNTWYMAQNICRFPGT